MTTNIFISSNDNEGTDPANVSVSLPIGIYDPAPRGVMLKDFIMPYFMYNMPNDITFSITEAGLGAVTMTLTAGNYNSTDLISSMKALITASALIGTYDITLSTITGKLTVKSTDATNFVISGNLWLEIGWDATTIAGMSNATTHTSPLLLDLSGHRYFYVVTAGLINGQSMTSNKDGSYNILAKIPTAVNFGEIIFYENKLPDVIPFRYDVLDSLQLMLVDENFNLLDIPTNTEWSLTLHLIY